MRDASDDFPLGQPHTASALLRTLHINDVSIDKQKGALREWLHDHTPDHELRLSLRRNGYGKLLDERFGRLMPAGRG
jgi:hypothetical protein